MMDKSAVQKAEGGRKAGSQEGDRHHGGRHDLKKAVGRLTSEQGICNEGSSEPRRGKMAMAVLAVMIGLGQIAPAKAAGLYQGYDPSTNPSFQTYVPTGNEFAPFDTQSSSPPYTEGMMAYQVAGVSGGNFRNALVGGDFGTNPWQRGTGASADISNTLTYHADQWWNLGGASSAINVSRQTGASDIVAGTTASLRFQRKSANADVAEICTGNVLTSGASTRFQGSTAIFSLSMKAGANFSASGSNVKLVIGYGTGSSQSAALFAAGTWTGYANAYTGNTAITTTMARYSVAAAIPATATQVGVKVCYTPVGTASTNDWIELANTQLEASGASVPSGSTLTLSQYAQPTTFAYRPPQIELALAQHYLYQISEATGPSVIGVGRSHSVTVAEVFVPFPVPLRAVPTMTYTAGFATETTAAGGTLGACSALGTSSTVTSTAAALTGVSVACTATTVPAAGVTVQLFSNGGSGVIRASAEL